MRGSKSHSLSENRKDKINNNYKSRVDVPLLFPIEKKKMGNEKPK